LRIASQAKFLCLNRESHQAAWFNVKELAMLHYALVFLVIALIAAVLGFGGIAAGAASIAKILFLVFLVLAVVAFFSGRRVL
jgi:uncharacterized membrane protein YtjA (UPF0391 family)